VRGGDAGQSGQIRQRPGLWQARIASGQDGIGPRRRRQAGGARCFFHPTSLSRLEEGEGLMRRDRGGGGRDRCRAQACPSALRAASCAARTMLQAVRGRGFRLSVMYIYIYIYVHIYIYIYIYVHIYTYTHTHDHFKR